MPRRNIPTRHPLRRKTAVVGVIEAAKNGALAVGLEAGAVDATTGVALAITTLLVELGVLVKKGEQDVTPVTDPRLDDGHAEEAL